MIGSLSISALEDFTFAEFELWLYPACYMDQIDRKLNTRLDICLFYPLFIVEVGIANFVDRQKWHKSIDMLVELNRNIVLASNVL